MYIDPESIDMLVAPVIISWDGNDRLFHGNTALFVYYANGKADLNESYLAYRRNEIIGMFGYDSAQKKYIFTTYTPGTSKVNARIIPGKKQCVINNSVLVDSGETIEVQNHQRVINFLLNKAH